MRYTAFLEMPLGFSDGTGMSLGNLISEYERLRNEKTSEINTGGKNMPCNLFSELPVELSDGSKRSLLDFLDNFVLKLPVKLSDGSEMSVRNLISEYERLWNEKTSKATITVQQKVGEWFRIDRKVIDENKEEIHRKCNELGDRGRYLWKRFEEANKIATENPNEYPRLIETYIFERNWDGDKTEQEMRDMCRDVGRGMCDEVICNLELQMKICNGESLHDLDKRYDKLPLRRLIKCRNGGSGYFGGGTDCLGKYTNTLIYKDSFRPTDKAYGLTPYAFRQVI